MKKFILLLISIASCFIASADQRGVSFEKDGLIYTIASEYVVRKRVVGRKATDPEYKIVNEGEVYVSGVTASNTVVTIPTEVYFPTTYCRSKVDTAKYNVLGIGEKAFEGATLTDLIIPHGLRFIGNEAFRNLKITNGVLVVPPTRRIKANVFDDMRSKVLITELEYSYGSNMIPIQFYKTFENTDRLPEIYVRHNIYGAPIENIDKRLLYTIGNNIFNEWTKNMSQRSKRPSTIMSLGRNGLFTFSTFSGVKTPTITMRAVKRYDKTGTDIDQIAPYEFICWNSYTQKREVFSEFAMNESIFRLKKDDTYLYFSLDGKPITDTESLIDSSGRDPFGFQVHSTEEMKAKNGAKERANNLNKKIKDLKNVFGF